MWIVAALTLLVVSSRAKGNYFLFHSNLKVDVVTCGSLLKLVNTDFAVRLHSHEVGYGSGSGQQSVTGLTDVTDGGSYWQASFYLCP